MMAARLFSRRVRVHALGLRYAPMRTHMAGVEASKDIKRGPGLRDCLKGQETATPTRSTSYDSLY